MMRKVVSFVPKDPENAPAFLSPAEFRAAVRNGAVEFTGEWKFDRGNGLTGTLTALAVSRDGMTVILVDGSDGEMFRADARDLFPQAERFYLY